jgi:hypothetical protein
MNLENLGLVELNAQEELHTDGGWIVKVLEGLAILATAALAYHEANCGKCNGTGYSTGAGSSGGW